MVLHHASIISSGRMGIEFLFSKKPGNPGRELL
jgi:hypothetical protein